MTDATKAAALACTDCEILFPLAISLPNTTLLCNKCTKLAPHKRGSTDYENIAVCIKAPSSPSQSDHFRFQGLATMCHVLCDEEEWNAKYKGGSDPDMWWS